MAQPRDRLAQLAKAYLWAQGPKEFKEARSILQSDARLRGVTRERFHQLEEILARGRQDLPSLPPQSGKGFALQEIGVLLPPGERVPVLVQLPPGYTPQRPWPMLVALHGGPPGSVEQAARGAARMVSVWADAAREAGWIVAAPVMTTVVSAGPRSRDRLPYEIFHQEQILALMAALRSRFQIDPDRIVATGISLGSNFSIAMAGSQPDRLAAIVPVSTEGDSRELLLRNLLSLPVYLLEGALDRNIRTLQGPRALRAILTDFGYDLSYHEFPHRSHEGFQEHYPDVLKWLAGRPRQVYPRQVLRVPHSGIMPVSRRLYWVASDTRSGLLRARAIPPSRIELTARWTRRITLFLHDRLVDMDQPVEIRVNGQRVFSGRVSRSVPAALRQVRRLGDERRIYSARLTLPVPAAPDAIEAGQRLWRELKPTHPEGPLSFWEMYATRALKERFPSLGFQGALVETPAPIKAGPEQLALRVTRVEPGGAVARAGLKEGDVLLYVDGEPFFAGLEGERGLYNWLIRELRSEPRTYPFQLWRDGKVVRLAVEYQLGPYAGPSSR
ncbi:MAG: alpha/beta hydrolase-fold protein [Acidobacteriota bacterium]